MKIKKILKVDFFVFFVFFINSCFPQGAAINTTGTPADPSAILDISSTNAGMLIPRMTKTQRNSINLPAEGLLIYQTDDTVGFWYHSTGMWKLIGSGAGSSITGGTSAGNTLYWNGSQWVESSNIFNTGGSVGIGTNSPEPTAIIDMSSTTKGALIPRMTTTERNAIQNPAEGLEIFNTTKKCFEYYAYGFWQTGNCATCFKPDAASAITGSSTVCQGDNNVIYSVPAINNATSYIWSYSGSGVTINGNSETISIDFSLMATSGIITVKGSNHCGDGNASTNFAINVNSVPTTPTASSHTSSQTAITWNWNTVLGATGYKYNTINNFSTATDNGTNTTYTQSSLPCNTSYTLYVWAYNNCGSSTELVLTESTTSCCAASFIDSRDGKTYQAVQIGTQCWMKENLNFTSANSWCYENNTNYCNTFGRLYTWDAATGGTSSSTNPSGIQGVCPTGWHVPSDIEWQQLEIFLGMDPSAANSTSFRGTDQGDQLKSTTIWTPGGTATNSSGFSALPGGDCLSGSAFYYLNSYGLWWTATEGDSSHAWRRLLHYTHSDVERSAPNKSDGFAVRCIRN